MRTVGCDKCDYATELEIGVFLAVQMWDQENATDFFFS